MAQAITGLQTYEKTKSHNLQMCYNFAKYSIIYIKKMSREWLGHVLRAAAGQIIKKVLTNKINKT